MSHPDDLQALADSELARELSARAYSTPRERAALAAAMNSTPPRRSKTRKLIYAEPDHRPDRLVLMEPTGEELVTYHSLRSFARIERDGRWFRLAGRDRDNGELIYLPEEFAA